MLFLLKKKNVFPVVQENDVNHVDLLAVTSFSSHLPFEWKKVIKVFPILEALHSNAYPMIFASVFVWAFGKGWGTKETE